MAEHKAAGNKAFASKNFEEAIACYDKAIEETPNDHTIYGNQAAAYQNMSNYNKALEIAEKCIEIKPDWSKGFQRKAMALQALGKLEEAVTAYEKGCDLDPSNGQCKVMLERCAQELMRSMGAGMPGGMPGMGGMPGAGGPGGAGGLGDMFGPQAEQKLMANPETAAFFSDPNFKNMWGLCQ